MEEAEPVADRHATQKEWDQRRRHAWDAVGFSRVRQQHLVNLEALAREQLLRHDWGALPATLAALLSAQDPQLNDAGEAGVPTRAERNAFVLDAAQELLSRSRGPAALQQQRLARLTAEHAQGAADAESRRLEVAALAAIQGDTDRAYDLLSAPVVGQFAQPDRFLRALLAGQLKHAVWLRGIQQAAAHVQPESRQPVQGAHSQAADGGAAALYMYDPAVAGALDARAAAAGQAAEKHLQEAVSMRPGAALPTWLLFQLLAAGGRAPEALALARAAAAAAPHDADAAALAALAAVADSAATVDTDGGGAGTASQGASQQVELQPMSQPQDGGAAAANLAAHDMAAQPSQQRAGGAAAGWLAALQCDPGSGEAFWGLRIACEGRLREPGARSVAAEGAALFLDMHLPGSGSEPGSKPAVAAAWRLLADALHAEAASLQADDAGGQPDSSSPVWATVAARNWWWPDVFFAAAAADAAVGDTLAAQPQQGAEESLAAGAELAAQAAVAAFVPGFPGVEPGSPGQTGGSFPERVMQLCQDHASLAHIADEVSEALGLARDVAWHQAAAAAMAPQPPNAAAADQDQPAATTQHTAAVVIQSDRDDRLPSAAGGRTGLKRSWWAAFPHRRRAAAA